MSNVPKAVKLSGVVYVKDPRDISQIRDLQEQVRSLKRDIKEMPSTKEIEKTELLLDQREVYLEEENEYIRERFQVLEKLKNMTVEKFLASNVDNSYRDSRIAQRIRKKLEGHKK